MTITIVNADHLTEDQYVSGFVGCVGEAWDWYKRYLETDGASPTRFFKLAKAQCDELGIECPVKLKTLQNKAGIWRRDGDVPPAAGNDVRGKAHPKYGKKGIPDSGKPVENSKPNNDDVNHEQQAAVEEIIRSKDEYIAQLHALLDEQAEKLKSTETSTLYENDQPQRIRQQQQLDDSSRLALVEVHEESGMDSDPLPPIDYDWHPGIQVGSKECDDYCRVGRLLDQAAAIVHEYFLEGKWGPREWESLAGAFGGPYNTCLAQRRFRPRSEQGPIIDIR